MQLAASGGDAGKSEAEQEASKWAEMAAKMEVGLTPGSRSKARSGWRRPVLFAEPRAHALARFVAGGSPRVMPDSSCSQPIPFQASRRPATCFVLSFRTYQPTARTPYLARSLIPKHESLIPYPLTLNPYTMYTPHPNP